MLCAISKSTNRCGHGCRRALTGFEPERILKASRAFWPNYLLRLPSEVMYDRLAACGVILWGYSFLTLPTDKGCLVDDMVCAFSGLTPEGQLAAGGKGGTLARLYQAGYPVPDGFVVLPAAFAGDELMPEAWAQVQAGLARLRGENAGAAFAVRSSALAEDSARASFAGEFETVLDVSSDDDVRSAIHTVRASRRSERVQAYSEARGIGGASGCDQEPAHAMAVVVQRLVRAEFSGVLFTSDPVTGSRDHMPGNYVHGLGDSLVSGEAAPLEFTLARPKGDYEGSSELKPYAGRLFKLAKRLERDLDGPQDIEWAVAQGSGTHAWPFGLARTRLFILQSRPITNLLGFDPSTGEANDSLTGDYVWSNVNLGEAVSAVMTPLTWSVMSAGFGQLDILPGHHTVGNIGGRLYQNGTVMVSFVACAGQGL